MGIRQLRIGSWPVAILQVLWKKLIQVICRWRLSLPFQVCVWTHMVCHKHVRIDSIDVNALRNQRQSISVASTCDVFCSSHVDFGRIQAAAQLGIDWKSNYDQLCSSLDLQFGSATGSIHDYISNSVRCSAGHLACGLEVAPQYQETNMKTKVHLEHPELLKPLWVMWKLYCARAAWEIRNISCKCNLLLFAVGNQRFSLVHSQSTYGTSETEIGKRSYINTMSKTKSVGNFFCASTEQPPKPLLHKAAFTQRSSYSKQRLPTQSSVSQHSYYTKHRLDNTAFYMLLHQTTFTQHTF